MIFETIARPPQPAVRTSTAANNRCPRSSSFEPTASHRCRMASSSIMRPTYACSPPSGIPKTQVTPTHDAGLQFSYCSDCPKSDLSQPGRNKHLKHLIPHAITKHGLDAKEWAIDDEALLTIIRRYTREAGVRNLERGLSTLIRKAVKELILSEKKSVKTSADNLADYLGVPKYRYGEVEDQDLIGVVTGLAWTDVGGELLIIEAAMMPGKGRMTVTGNLRDVMKESISAAASYVRSRAVAFGIEPPLFDQRDIHVHVPEGATPKDGPSAGVAMVTAIVSVMTGIPVRRDLAMTGEITLRGRVWPIAGLKEKLLAALRGGIKTVLIPEENAKDLVEIADSIKSGLEIVPVSRMDEVLARAMTRKLEPIEWDETTITAAAVPEEAPVEEEASTLTAH